MASPTDSTPEHGTTENGTDDPRPVPAPWGPASGVGSLPGTDPAEAVRLVVGELPGFAHLPELPARGVGADVLGRSAGLLVDVHVDLTPAGWRLVPRPGRDEQRAHEFLDRDLDALHDVAADWTGPFKVQSAGPWTLAAGLERTRGDRAVTDPGARRDIAQSLAEGLRAHAAAVAARLPGADVVIQVDEPSLPAVLLGGLPTQSGFGKLAAIEAHVVQEELEGFLSTLGHRTVVHCCATRAPLGLIRAAGADALSFDHGLVQDLDDIGQAVEAGTHLFLGVVPGTDRQLPAPKATATRLQAWWNELGFPAESLHEAVTLTPSCGLAGASPAYARAAMAHVREAARYLLPE